MTVGVMCASVPPHPKYQGKARCHKETVLGTVTAVGISDFTNSAACSGLSLKSVAQLVTEFPHVLMNKKTDC